MPFVWGAAIGAIAGIGSSLISSDATSSAADTQAAATQAGINAQQSQYNQTRADFTPYRELGYRTLPTLESEVNRMPTAQEVQSQPGYQFGLKQGQQALDRKAAASGGRVSGAALKSASEYATNYATTGYNAEYQRRQDRLNRLAALAGIGQSATGSSAAAGAGATNAISGMLTSQGDASAAAQLSRGNIWGNAVNQAAAQGQRYSSPNYGGSPDYGTPYYQGSTNNSGSSANYVPDMAYSDGGGFA